MRDLADKLKQVEQLRDAIESKGLLPPEVLKKIEQKFRLECNFSSNQIEGGTLTRQETRSVMIGNITVEGKPLKGKVYLELTYTSTTPACTASHS